MLRPFYSYGTVLHEPYHALGFCHEHDRSERDDYVRIHYARIPRDERQIYQDTVVT